MTREEKLREYQRLTHAMLETRLLQATEAWDHWRAQAEKQGRECDTWRSRAIAAGYNGATLAAQPEPGGMPTRCASCGATFEYVPRPCPFCGARLAPVPAAPDPRGEGPCPGCAKGETPVMLDDDGVLTSVSGRSGRLGHAIDDFWWYCDQYEPEPAPETGADEPRYPCDRCGKLRTKAEGGTTFTVCDECWDATAGRAQERGEDAEALGAEVQRLVYEALVEACDECGRDGTTLPPAKVLRDIAENATDDIVALLAHLRAAPQPVTAESEAQAFVRHFRGVFRDLYPSHAFNLPEFALASLSDEVRTSRVRGEGRERAAADVRTLEIIARNLADAAEPGHRWPEAVAFLRDLAGRIGAASLPPAPTQREAPGAEGEVERLRSPLWVKVLCGACGRTFRYNRADDPEGSAAFKAHRASCPPPAATVPAQPDPSVRTDGSPSGSATGAHAGAETGTQREDVGQREVGE